jgi:hypothetical protein
MATILTLFDYCSKANNVNPTKQMATILTLFDIICSKAKRTVYVITIYDDYKFSLFGPVRANEPA